MFGLDGDDDLDGGAGNDTIDGGAGFDQALYKGSRTTFTAIRNLDGSVSISDGTSAEGVDVFVGVEAVYFAGDDTWIEVDHLVGALGTDSDDTWIAGTDHADRLIGLGGDDVIAGYAGADTLHGGDGDDTTVFFGGSIDFTFLRNADGSVTASGGVLDGVDTLFDMEAIYFQGDEMWVQITDLVGNLGTVGDDPWIAGTDGADRLYGYGGDDVIAGYGGADELHGGDGADTAIFFGDSTDFTFVRNGDQGVTATGGSQDGTDKLFDVEFVYFEGDELWTTLADLLGETVARAPTAPDRASISSRGFSTQAAATAPQTDEPEASIAGLQAMVTSDVGLVGVIASDQWAKLDATEEGRAALTASVPSPGRTWWRAAGQGSDPSARSLGSLLAAMENWTATTAGPVITSVDQGGQLLRQSMAGFTGEAGGEMVDWRRFENTPIDLAAPMDRRFAVIDG